jgi:hypothetical protein
MNDTDKDLINAYLDGETNASESAQVEALLDSDPEAFEYSNQLKQSNIEINNFFKGASMDSLEQSVDNFIAERSASNSNSDSALPRFNFGSLSAGIASMLSPSRAVGAMAAFAVVGVLVLPTIFQSEFDDPDMKIFTVPVTRSATLENSSLDTLKIIEKAMMDMDELNIDISKVIFANNDEVFIKFTNVIQDCYEGFFLDGDKKSNITFCPKSNENILQIHDVKKS